MSDPRPPCSQPPAPPQPFPDPIPRILPFGGVSLVAGAAGTGKTAWLAGFLRDLRDGRPIFGHQPSPINGVGIITSDRGWERGAGFWFNRAGYGDIAHYSMVDDPRFDARQLRRKFDRTKLLLDFIDRLKLPPGSVVAVDPIGLFLGGNLIDYDTCAVACLELRAGLRDRQLTIAAGTAHSGKMRADKSARYLRLQDAILGSAALFGFGDTQMYLAAPEEIGKPYYAFLWHPHEAPPELFSLERDENGLFLPYTGVDRGSCTRILTLLPEDGEPLAMVVLAERAEGIPLTRRTVERGLLQLIEEGKVAKVRRGVYHRILVH